MALAEDWRDTTRGQAAGRAHTPRRRHPAVDTGSAHWFAAAIASSVGDRCKELLHAGRGPASCGRIDR